LRNIVNPEPPIIVKPTSFAIRDEGMIIEELTQLNEANNQPVLKEDIIIIHNGIIVNVDQLWKQHPDLERTYSIDTEIIPALIRKQLKSTNDLAEACNTAFEQLEGTWSMAIMFHDLDQFVLATNNGSLYYITDNENFITLTGCLAVDVTGLDPQPGLGTGWTYVNGAWVAPVVPEPTV
jgi:hypothetical protein